MISCPTYSTTGTTSLPWPSTALVILNAASACAHASHTEVSARCSPGHMRRPKPNTNCFGSASGACVDVAMNRSGLNAIGSAYVRASCVNFLYASAASATEETRDTRGEGQTRCSE